MDLVLRNVRLVDGGAVVITDIGVADGRIAALRESRIAPRPA